jgi:hypothetical protein
MWHRLALAALAGEVDRAKKLAAELATETESHGLRFWMAMAQIFIAWNRFSGGDAAGAADALPGLIECVAATGTGLFAAQTRSILAEAQAATGNGIALQTIAESEALARHSGALFLLAEIQRREGVILRCLRPDDRDAAEGAFRRALATARGQEARFWELRSAIDLARLLVKHGERQQALDLLAPIHGWFTEGFDLPDLIEAKAVLGTLYA